MPEIYLSNGGISYLISLSSLFLAQEMTAYKKKMQDGAPVVGSAPANTVKSDSEEEWKEDDE